MPKLNNEVQANATFGALTTYDISNVSVDIPAIKVSKSADMDIWQGDTLTYTVNLENLDDTVEATSISVVDIITPSLAKLDVESVTADGQSLTLNTHFTYSDTTGELSITVLPNINPLENYDITFQVTKA